MKLLAFLLLLAGCVPAGAQSVRQSGNITPGHVTSWTTQGVVQDGGTAASGNLTSLGVTGSGPTICANSAAITGPYNQVCLGVSTNGGTTIYSNALGGATNTGIVISQNGVISALGSITCAALGAFSVGTGSATQCSTVGGAIATLNGGPLTVTADNSTLNAAIVTNQNPSGTVAATNGIALNGINIGQGAAENVNVSFATAFAFGFLVEHQFGGTNAQGGRVGLGAELALAGATNSLNNNRNYQALYGAGIANASDGGINPTQVDSRGAIFGAGIIARLAAAATNMSEVTSAEFNTDARTGSTTFKKTGIRITQLSTDAVAASGTDLDAAIQLVNQPGSVGWKIGIGLGDNLAQAPLQSTGVFIKAVGSQTMDTFIDISNVTITTNILKTANYTIDLNGNVTTTGQVNIAWLMAREITAATPGNALTIQAGGAVSGGTNLNGGGLVLSSGTATGSGSSAITFKTANAGGGGITDRTPTEAMRLYQSAGYGTLNLRNNTLATDYAITGAPTDVNTYLNATATGAIVFRINNVSIGQVVAGGLQFPSLGLGSAANATGLLITNALVLPSGNGQGVFGASATGGNLIAGQGSTNDLTLENSAGASVCTVATGTTTLGCIIFNATTGFRIGGAAASGNVLRGNGTNFVSATLATSDLSDIGTFTLSTSGTIKTTNVTNATTSTTGSLQTSGGLGVAKQIVAGDLIHSQGSNGGFEIDRRDTNATAFTMYSAAGNLQFFDTTRGADGFTITANGGGSFAGTISAVITQTSAVNMACYNSGSGLFTYSTIAQQCTVSSARYKQDIASMDSERSLQIASTLTPVTFKYKPEADFGDDMHSGLLAEEVASIAPELTIYDSDGLPYAIKQAELPFVLFGAIKQLKTEFDAYKRLHP